MDALGSTRGITGSTGAATDALVYDAFGETLTRSGSTATPVQFAGTSGYQVDATTRLLLLGHRYYDASIGRFLSSDPAQAGSNWYAYCDNNPLVRVDPTGLIKNIKWKGASWTARISDPDTMKGFPHWDGPGGYIGNDGKFHPKHGHPQDTNKEVERQVKEEVDKLKEEGHDIISPKQWMPHDPSLTDISGGVFVLPIAIIGDPFAAIGTIGTTIGDGIGEAVGGIGDAVGGILRGVGSLGRGLVRAF